MRKRSVVISVIIAAAVIGAIVALRLLAGHEIPVHGQEMGGMEMNQTGEAAMESPVIMTTDDGKINVMLSWVPETISVDKQPTTFTIEFLDADTEQRLNNVTYSVHMTIDGKDLGHGHNGTAVDGLATIEQEFDSVGTLGMVAEIHNLGSDDVSQFVQFTVAVTPELRVALIALAAGVAATTGLSILRARSRL
jgi:hypothetical protein